MLLTKYTPPSLRQSGLYKQLSRRRRVWNLRKQAATTRPLKVMLGAGPVRVPGWLQTDKELLDVTSQSDWSALFEPESIDSLLSEHMLEHLTETEARIALTECYRYLQPGGLFRIAVPDGYRRDAAYVAEASPPNDGHQVLYNIDSLTALLQSVGFATTALEYFDAQEQFHAVPWDEKEGLIRRSARFDTQQDFRRGVLFYTSVIVDARKP
ncbi:MAG TPA: methyltransferase domain-containing protein [Pyrinomonadaceae bacterium]|nr:methyltransferase domain-containing protein [Pyrinomonadaceae bacterium]